MLTDEQLAELKDAVVNALVACQACKSINQFCKANNISRSTYYVLRTQGRGPAETIAHNKILISAEVRTGLASHAHKPDRA